MCAVCLPLAPNIEFRLAGRLCLVELCPDGLPGRARDRLAALGELRPVGQAGAFAVVYPVGDQRVRCGGSRGWPCRGCRRPRCGGRPGGCRRRPGRGWLRCRCARGGCRGPCRGGRRACCRWRDRCARGRRRSSGGRGPCRAGRPGRGRLAAGCRGWRTRGCGLGGPFGRFRGAFFPCR